MRHSLFISAAALILLSASSTFAGFATSATAVSPSGSIGGSDLVPAPPVALGDTSANYQVWNENSGTISSVPPSGVFVENNGNAGSYTGVTPGSSTTLAPGTPYGTTFVQLNPNTAGTVKSGSVVIDFSSKIIGIALSGATSPSNLGSLDKTDAQYGAPGTTYPTGYNPANNRGILGHTNDFFTISASGTELTVHLTANNFGYKELRVFTAGSATGVPEPASLAIWSLVGTVFVGGSWWRRQRPAV